MRLKIKKRLALLSLLLFLPWLAGCWNRVELNQAAIVSGLGIDLEGNDHIKFIVQVITPQSSGGSEEKGQGGGGKPYQTFEGTDITVAKAARDISLTVPRIFLWSHANAFIFGENMAQKGIRRTVDFLDRNRNVRKNSLVFVAKGNKASRVLKAESAMGGIPMNDLVQMVRLQDQGIGIYTPIDMGQFLNSLGGEGKDPIMPAVDIVKQDGKEVLHLAGMAVFKDDRLVGYLNERESRGYRWIRGNPPVQGGLFSIKSPVSNAPILLENIRSSASIMPVIKGDKISFKIKINQEGNFYEQGDTSEVLTPKMIKTLEARAATQIENEIRTCLNRSKELNSDFVGFGSELSRSNPDLWDKIGKRWDELYPTVDFEFDIKAKIRRTYLTDKSFHINQQ